MESVVLENSPLADYLEDAEDLGVEDVPDLDRERDRDRDTNSSSPSPTFAPRGRPRPKFRQRLPPPLRLSVPPNSAVAVIHDTCSKAVNSRLGRADNSRFLERFRYIIVASQLLGSHSYISQYLNRQPRETTIPSPDGPQLGALSLAGVAVTALFAFALVWLLHWTRGGDDSTAGKSRVVIFLLVAVIITIVSYAYMRRQWLQYLRQQTIAEVSDFVIRAQEFDHSVAGAMTLVQEVELVSRGYRISTPLPPITRLEDRSQTRRCSRLRKHLHSCFAEVLPRYTQACIALRSLAEEMDLDKYYDIYDLSESDLAEAMRGHSDAEFEDVESLRVLKILAARCHTARRIFLCCLLALDANGGKPDFLRWGTAVDEIHGVSAVNDEAGDRLRRILNEEEAFPVPPTPKAPLTPGRERWRAQLRKLNSLSSGIRGLQAKMHILREESDRSLNETEDVSELGTNLMIQYESVGVDLKALMQEWEDGKAALASNIDRNERRISSMSGMLSPTTSLGGLTAVEEGNVMDALRALNGEPRYRSSMDLSSSSDVEEVFEAIAMPRQRSNLTREERIAKMKENRVKRDSVKISADANTKMLRELESVINLRPRGRTTPAGRITSI